MTKGSRGEKFESLLDIMARLRAPDGCPWDREQGPLDLSPHIIEEAYELIEALEGGQTASIVEESGDLLLQVVFLAQMAAEEGRYDMGDVVDAIASKLVRRHPHVFGDVEVADSGDVARNWEEIKGQERREKKKRDTLLSGLPRGLPALLKAHQLQERAAKVGFDWPQGDLDSVLDKVSEEIEELRQAHHLGQGGERVEEELGDLFFALANLARHLGLNGEVLVQRANDKFTSRFNYIEDRVRSTGRPWKEHSLEELEGLWQEAKGFRRRCKS